MNAKRYSRILNPYWNEGFPDEVPPESEWMKVDVDRYWKKVIKMDLEKELIHELSDHYFWQVTLDHMPLTDAQRKTFSRGFFTSEARRGRLRAILGTIAFNRMSASHLVNATNAIWANIFPNYETGEHSKLMEDEEGREWDLGRIGWEFVRLVSERNHKCFTKIAEILKEESDAPASTDSQTPPLLNYNQAWRGFCAYVRDNKTLPSKLTFKNVGGLLKSPQGGKSAHGDSNGTKAMKALGLKGLPD